MKITPQHIQDFLIELQSEESTTFIESITKDLGIGTEGNPLVNIFNAIKSQYPDLKKTKAIQIDKNHKQVMDSFTKLEKSMEAQVKTFATKEEYTQNKNSLSRLWKIVWTVITFVFMAIAWVAGWAMMEFIKNS